MPITEYRPSFLYEAWALFGIGTIVILTRFAIRIKTVGFRGFKGDDFFSILVLIFYVGDAFTVHLIYYLGTNVEAQVIGKTRPLTDHDVAEFTEGSQLELTAWYCYTALIWSLKGTMLCFFFRMTMGTFHILYVKVVSVVTVIGYVVVFLTITFSCWPYHKNWMVTPDPGAKCTFKKQNFVVTTVFNVLTDGMIFCIPLPLLWKLKIPARKKIVTGILLSSGAFVISAAIVRVVLTLSSKPSALTINGWGVRETIVGIITVNIPVLRPLFTKSFWTGVPTQKTKTISFRTATRSGMSKDVTGPHDLTTFGDLTVIEAQGDESDPHHLSFHSIGHINSVTVHRSFDITREHNIPRKEPRCAGHSVCVRGGSDDIV